MDDSGFDGGLAPPSPVDPMVRRSAVVGRAARAWASQIVDLGGRNNLLFYRDLKVGMIDLTPSDLVDDDAVGRLIGGRATRLSRIVAADDLAMFARRGRAVRRKADENYEERGLATLFITHGMATWSHSLSAATPCAPVALAPLRLTPRGGAAEDFDLDVDGDWRINPTLLHLLQVDFGLDLDPDDLLAGSTSGDADNSIDMLDVHHRIVDRCGDVPGFAVVPRVVVGNFSYAKQPLALDIEASVEAMARHPIVSAIAGDEHAQRELIDAQPIADISEPDHGPPAEEYLILDADASQSAVVNAAVKGASLVVQGPPGTGKSQTIANLIATLAAHGRSTLFVAEKRAAIDAVTKRLDQTGLESLVMDLHGGTRSKRELLRQVGRALDTIGSTPAVERQDEDDHLVRDRDRLNSFDNSLHRNRGPDGPSVYEMQSELIGIDSQLRSERTLPRAIVETISWHDLGRIEAEVAEWVRLGGPSLGMGVHPWEVAAGKITSTEQAERALDVAQRLATDTVPEASHCLGALAAETALARPTSIAEWEDATALVAEVESTLHNYDVGIFDADLDALAGALAPASEGLVARGAASVFNGRYRRARKAAWKLARVDREPAELLVDVGRARDQRSKWAHRAVDRGLPRIPPSFEPARTALDRLTSQLDALTEWTGDDQRDRSLDEAHTTARELVDDRTTLFRLPRLHEIRADLDHHGLSAALDEAGDRRLGAEDAGALIRSIWLQSMLDLVGLSDPDIGTFDGTAHTDLVAEFGNHDRGHIGDGARRVMRRAAERAVATLNAHPEQAQLVRQQAGRRRGHLPLRELLSRAPDVLIAVKPCWAMSPLVVSQLLPNDPPLFDFVIFDEASQIPPAEAVPAILRGRQLVVAGDSRQLPPTTFFSTSVEPQDDPDDDGPEDDAGTELVTEDMESILDAMTTMLPPPHGSKTLDWHYRSRDERLIAFSNAQPSLYDSTVTTFPGVGIDKPIQHVHVPWAPVVAGKDQSVEDEVQAVVDLVVQHARDSPDATLGVIAMGIVHADRIAETLRLERKTDPTLDAFLAAHPDEPFFVKNLERVQGDERDDIIITIGYGKNADGQMVYRFGPLNQQGGERRLNVAITRAREQVILVSSFGPEDLDDSRLHAEGARMLKRYITYAASGGAELGVVARPRQTLNPFENDILHQLGAAGVPVIPQLGVSGYSIDFAAVHPDDPARYVLAIEADGASYHSSATARDRDRLRQEHLERLGWRFHRIWSTEWFHHRDREVERAMAAWRAAVGERQHIPGNAPAALPPPLTAAAAAADPPRGPSTTTSVPGRSDPRPKIRRDEPITAYSDPELDAIVEWVRSDTLLRTDDELLALTVQELGYRRKGSRIVAAVEAAIERTRSSDAPTPAAPANGLTAPVVGSRPLTPPPTPGASGEGITGEV